MLDQGCPPIPRYTEAQIPNLTARVFLVTGAASGVGFELASMLYDKGATVYVGARSKEKAQKASEDLKRRHPQSKGQLCPYSVDLSDMLSVRAAAENFLRQETRLDVLVNNAGIMQPPNGSQSVQGYDLEMGTNVLGPFLLTKLLTPLLQKTAVSAPPNSVRCVWVSSMIALGAPKGGVIFDELTGAPKVHSNPMENYIQSKVSNVFLAKEAAKRSAQSQVLHVSVHPGLIRKNLQQHQPPSVGWIMGNAFKPARLGAYSEAFAALSSEVTLKDHNGAFIIPWGRFGPIPKHIEASVRSKGDLNGTGISAKVWEWCEGEVAKY